MGKSSNKTVDTKELKKRRDAANKKFEIMNRKEEEVDRQIERLQERKMQIKLEKLRLQGEHRVLTEMIGDNPDEDPEDLSTNQKEDGNDVQSQKG